MTHLKALQSSALRLGAAALFSLAACDGDVTAAPPVTGGPLIPGTWYMHFANDSALPASVSVRSAGVAQEKTMLDSARLVLNSDLTYSQRYWTRVLLNGVLDRTEVIVDEGTFAPQAIGFVLTSQLRTRQFSLVVPALGTVTTSEQMVFYVTDPPITTGTYKLSHP